MNDTASADRYMSQAIELAKQGRGYVEPNPMVGCILVREETVVGKGYHQKFGGPHAEVEAIKAAGEAAHGATAYITLEPCCHHGKTGPCTEALLAAGVSQVYVGCEDPNPQVAGKGIAALQTAGVEVRTGVLETQARQLIAPFTKLMRSGHPWVIAKWAMTLDGKIATRTGSSQWISGEISRTLVHKIRGDVDAVIVGRGTAEADDPLLTARPAGPRVATRVVFDSQATLSLDSKLIATAHDTPLLVISDESSSEVKRQQLCDAGAEVFVVAASTPEGKLEAALAELGRRQMTNVSVEGGGTLLGTFLDARSIDEVHVFVASKLIGGASAKSPIEGIGGDFMSSAWQLDELSIEKLGNDVHIHGFPNLG